MTDKRFPPSLKRIEDARGKGKTIKSRLVSTAVGWWVLLVIIPPAVAWVSQETLIHYEHQSNSPQAALGAALMVCGKVLGLVFGVTALVTFSIAWLQTRLLFVPSLVAPEPKRLDPFSFPQKVKEGALDVMVGFGRCFLLLCFVAPIFSQLLFVCSSSWLSTESDSGQTLIGLVQTELTRGAVAITVLAGLGYGVARWKFFRQHSMSLEEVREEYKQDEGDPHVKSARKHEHEALVMGEIERRVKKAKVIVVRKMPVQ